MAKLISGGTVPSDLILNTITFDRTSTKVRLRSLNSGELLIDASGIAPVAGIRFRGDADTILGQGSGREIATNRFYTSQFDGAGFRFRAINGNATIQYWALETDSLGNLVINTQATGAIKRVNLPAPTNVSPIPSSPWQPDVNAYVILYITVQLNASTAAASALFEISPDNTNWFVVHQLAYPAPLGVITNSICVLVPNGWYIRWSLTNAAITRITKMNL